MFMNYPGMKNLMGNTMQFQTPQQQMPPFSDFGGQFFLQQQQMLNTQPVGLQTKPFMAPMQGTESKAQGPGEQPFGAQGEKAQVPQPDAQAGPQAQKP